MTTHTSLALLAALGVLALATPTLARAQVDTSQWTCSSCPYPKGSTATVDIGLGQVSDASAKFGDWTGLQKDGAHLLLGGSVLHRSGSYYAELNASELGLGSRELSAQAGREGLYNLQLGYTRIPRSFCDGAVSPFLGAGSSSLTLPAGYGHPTTAQMPAASLQPLELSSHWERMDLSARFLGGQNWQLRVNLRRDVREGSRPATASFFSTAAQMPLPVDQVTDQLEVAASVAYGPLRANLAYQVSQFSNDAQAFSFANPFSPRPGTSSQAQLALAPDNQFHQLVGSAGYTLSPMVRFSGDFAIGRLKQNESFLAASLNPSVLPTLPAWPAASLDGQVDTFHGSLRATLTPLPNLRFTAAYIRDERDNQTGVRSWPLLSSELPYFGGTLTNTPFSVMQDRWQLGADWRGPAGLRLAAGVEQDKRNRSYQEVVDTDETTLWLRASARPHEAVALQLKAAHAERDISSYGTATWLSAPENPLLRKYQLAARDRDSASARVDLSIGENLSIGLGAEMADDKYGQSLVGLSSARSNGASMDVAYSVSEALKFTAFAHAERIRSSQAGSAAFRAPDWWARSSDRFEIVGIGARYAAIPDKLDLGADVAFSRARSTISTSTALGDDDFPVNKTDVDSVKLFATYKINDEMSLTGSWWYEKLTASDWQLDGILPSTVSTLLAFGQQAPRHKVNVLRVVLRYRF